MIAMMETILDQVKQHASQVIESICPPQLEAANPLREDQKVISGAWATYPTPSANASCNPGNDIHKSNMYEIPSTNTPHQASWTNQRNLFTMEPVE